MTKNEKTITFNPVNAMLSRDFPQQKSRWHIIKAGLLYFAIVFTVGFVLGIIRVLWAVPQFGTRAAELMETPVMLVTIILTARWVVRRLAIPPKREARLGMGLTALSFLLIAEFGLVLRLRGMSIDDYVATRDPVSGMVYYLMLGVLAVMPWIMSRVKVR